jgi:hypothetical protein
MDFAGRVDALPHEAGAQRRIAALHRGKEITDGLALSVVVDLRARQRRGLPANGVV